MSLQVHSQDWNNCGGNSMRNGLSPITGPDAPLILWQGSEISLFGLPVLIEGNILVTSRYISGTNSPVFCYDLTTGQLLWTADVTDGTGRSWPIGIRDGRVYVLRTLEAVGGDSLVALDASTGDHLWTAEQTTSTNYVVGCTFADNGDLIVEGYLCLLRIDATDGSTVWSAPIFPGVLGWLCPTIFGNTVYAQQNSSEPLVALDIATGDIKYTKAVSPNAQGEIMVGADGTIYVESYDAGQHLTALEDTGDSLHVLWTTPVTGYTVFYYMAESPDSTIYAPSNGKIMRFLKTTGAIIDSTDFLGDPDFFYSPMVSVGADGKVYIAAGSTVLCTEPDLTTIFSETVPNLNESGCALGPNHVMAVAGAGTELRVYRPIADGAENAAPEKLHITLYPNPSKDILFIECSEIIDHMQCLNYLGQTVNVVLDNNFINISALSSGLYFIDIKTRGGKAMRDKFVKE